MRKVLLVFLLLAESQISSAQLWQMPQPQVADTSEAVSLFQIAKMRKLQIQREQAQQEAEKEQAARDQEEHDLDMQIKRAQLAKLQAETKELQQPQKDSQP